MTDPLVNAQAIYDELRRARDENAALRRAVTYQDAMLTRYEALVAGIRAAVERVTTPESGYAGSYIGALLAEFDKAQESGR